MIEIIVSIILIVSFSGMLVIFLRKVPVLISLPQKNKSPKKDLFFKLKEKILRIRSFRSFSFESFLEKFLSKIRILTLKTDRKTSCWLQQLRENNRKKKERENDNYWQDLK